LKDPNKNPRNIFAIQQANQIFVNQVNQASNRSLAILGLTMHLIQDIYAHQVMMSKDKKDWKISCHYDKSLEDNTDFFPWRAAKAQTATNILAELYAKSVKIKSCIWNPNSNNIVSDLAGIRPFRTTHYAKTPILAIETSKMNYSIQGGWSR